MKCARLQTFVLGIGLVTFTLPLAAQQRDRDREDRIDRADRREQRDQTDNRRPDRDPRDARAERVMEADKRGWKERVVDPKQLPGEVKNTIGQQAGNLDKATEAIKLTRGDQTLYRVLIEDGTSMVFILNDKGQLLSKENVTELGRKRVEYDTLPGEVKGTLAKEFKPEDIQRVTQVTRTEKTWYVAQVRDDEGTRLVRVGANGEILDHGDLPDETHARLLSAGTGGGLRNRDRDREREFQENHFRGWKTAKITENELPGEVRNTLGQNQHQGDRVTHVSRLTRDGKTMFLIEVEGANQYARTYRIDQNGKLLDVDNTTEEGRQRVEYETLPGEVKSTLAQYGKPEEMTIYSITRADRTFYVAKTSEKTLRIGRDGKLMTDADFPERRGNRDELRPADQRLRDLDRTRDRDRDRERDSIRQ